MNYRPLGKTGLQVSALGFGAAPLGGAYGNLDESEAIRSVRLAIDSGINFIDTAPYYGPYLSEMVLGKALQGVPRDSYVLATKIGRYGLDDFDFSAERVVKSVDESLKRLGLDHIDLIQCHDIEFGLLDQVVDETLPALEKIRDQGKVRFIGVTGLPLKPLVSVIQRREVDTVLAYCHYTLLDTTLADKLPIFRSHHLGIISASPLGMGLLTKNGPPAWHPALPPIRAAAARAAAYCEERGLDIAKIAVTYSVNSNSDIATTLVGMCTEAEVRNNLECVGAEIDYETVKAVIEIIGDARNLTWPSGRLENS